MKKRGQTNGIVEQQRDFLLLHYDFVEVQDSFVVLHYHFAIAQNGFVALHYYLHQRFYTEPLNIFM
jgi:hypothetical protein